MIDKDKVMKSVECCLRFGNTNMCGECSYKNVAYDCKHALIKDVYELLKEQKTETEKLIGFINGFSKDAVPVVRCKDCHYGEPVKNAAGDDCIKCNNDDLWLDGNLNFPDWYCADGEKAVKPK